mmetsp:Transcript_29760/g.58416  ORF Transcript_29760/g.58416 Transcript_29760/m.58416 type:complete len:230 (-) Transcript_29760:19-708(-)
MDVCVSSRPSMRACTTETSKCQEDRWMDGWMDRCMDGWMHGWMDGNSFSSLDSILAIILSGPSLFGPFPFPPRVSSLCVFCLLTVSCNFLFFLFFASSRSGRRTLFTLIHPIRRIFAVFFLPPLASSNRGTVQDLGEGKGPQRRIERKKERTFQTNQQKNLKSTSSPFLFAFSFFRPFRLFLKGPWKGKRESKRKETKHALVDRGADRPSFSLILFSTQLQAKQTNEGK